MAPTPSPVFLCLSSCCFAVTFPYLFLFPSFKCQYYTCLHSYSFPCFFFINWLILSHHLSKVSILSICWSFPNQYYQNSSLLGHQIGFQISMGNIFLNIPLVPQSQNIRFTPFIFLIVKHPTHHCLLCHVSELRRRQYHAPKGIQQVWWNWPLRLCLIYPCHFLYLINNGKTNEWSSTHCFKWFIQESKPKYRIEWCFKHFTIPKLTEKVFL